MFAPVEHFVVLCRLAGLRGQVYEWCSSGRAKARIKDIREFNEIREDCARRRLSDVSDIRVIFPEPDQRSRDEDVKTTVDNLLSAVDSLVEALGRETTRLAVPQTPPDTTEKKDRALLRLKWTAVVMGVLLVLTLVGLVRLTLQLSDLRTMLDGNAARIARLESTPDALSTLGQRVDGLANTVQIARSQLNDLVIGKTPFNGLKTRKLEVVDANEKSVGIWGVEGLTLKKNENKLVLGFAANSGTPIVQGEIGRNLCFYVGETAATDKDPSQLVWRLFNRQGRIALAFTAGDNDGQVTILRGSKMVPVTPSPLVLPGFEPVPKK